MRKNLCAVFLFFIFVACWWDSSCWHQTLPAQGVGGSDFRGSGASVMPSLARQGSERTFTNVTICTIKLRTFETPTGVMQRNVHNRCIISILLHLLVVGRQIIPLGVGRLRCLSLDVGSEGLIVGIGAEVKTPTSFCAYTPIVHAEWGSQEAA